MVKFANKKVQLHSKERDYPSRCTELIKTMVIPFGISYLNHTRSFQKVSSDCSSWYSTIGIKLNLHKLSKTTAARKNRTWFPELEENNCKLLSCRWIILLPFERKRTIPITIYKEIWLFFPEWGSICYIV